MSKRGQITVFIIIGLIILLVIGTVLYITRREVTREFEAVRPSVSEIPQQVQPLRDQVEQCILRLGTDGLRRIGDSGGYIETSSLLINPVEPTEGEAVQFSPDAGPTIAYWWHLKSPNKCQPPNCDFDTKRPGLRRGDEGLTIEGQLDQYVTNNLKECLGNFAEYKRLGCDVQELGDPQVTSNVAQDDVFFVGKYPLRAVCEEQTFEINDYYVNIDVNLREIYELATEFTNLQSQENILEQATKTLISTFSAVDRNKLPPTRSTEMGPPSPSVFWIQFNVKQQLKQILSAYIPLLQASGVRNYQFIPAPPDHPDQKQYELIYNRQFFIPQNESHPTLEAHFMYLDWWEPYLDLHCGGQLCRADSATNFELIPFTINRYNFPYDLSYPVLVEIRNPFAFGGEGYSFKFFLEQNLRASQAIRAEASPFKPATVDERPSIFCNPDQQTSGTITVNVKDGKNLQPMEKAIVSFICGGQNCNFGLTEKGILATKFPRCVGGILRVSKHGYATHASMLDTGREAPINISLTLEPIKVLNASIKNYAITKTGKRESWDFKEGGPLRPSDYQETLIQLVRNGTPFDEPYSAIVNFKGDNGGEIKIIPGNYTVSISSFYKGNITIPPDKRCFKIKKITGSKKKCYNIPADPIHFNESSPLPYGAAEYYYEFTPTMLRGAKSIEFREFVLAIDKVPENQRIVEDLGQLDKAKMYATANLDRIYPVIT